VGIEESTIMLLNKMAEILIVEVLEVTYRCFYTSEEVFYLFSARSICEFM